MEPVKEPREAFCIEKFGRLRFCSPEKLYREGCWLGISLGDKGPRFNGGFLGPVFGKDSWLVEKWSGFVWDGRFVLFFVVASLKIFSSWSESMFCCWISAGISTGGGAGVLNIKIWALAGFDLFSSRGGRPMLDWGASLELGEMPWSSGGRGFVGAAKLTLDFLAMFGAGGFGGASSSEESSDVLGLRLAALSLDSKSSMSIDALRSSESWLSEYSCSACCLVFCSFIMSFSSRSRGLSIWFFESFIIKSKIS